MSEADKTIEPMADTKKDKILKIFNSKPWINGRDWESKIITYDDFRGAGLDGNWEYQEKYNDVAYAQQIFIKMGFNTAVGMALHIYKKTKQ